MKPLVVLWGPDLAIAFPEVVQIDGVTVCPGHQLAHFLRSLPAQVDAGIIRAAFAKLDEYVERRDSGEAVLHGDPARTVGQHYGDLAAVATTFGGALVAMLSVAPLKPAGVWSIVVAVGLVLLGVGVRRRRWAGTRTLRVTTTLITTAGGLSGLLLAALVLGT